MVYKDPKNRREYQRKYYQKNKKHLLPKHKKYGQDHKEERNAYGKIYRQKHKAKMKVYYKKHYQEHKKEKDAYRKKYRQEYPDKCREAAKKYYLEHLEEKRIYEKKHYQKYPEKGREKSRRRIARKLNAPGSHTAEQINFLRIISGGFCLGHNKPPHWVGKEKLTVDHITPLTKGGSDYIENIQMMCGSCNSAKGVSL